ncbi:MAG: N-acetyltransferase [Gammaproteobacteria bacterium]|nr:N-acetyltransferase [Gammaproteobacteria bacterium]
MNLIEFQPTHTKEVVQLFQEVFTDSEGEVEGQTLAQLVQDLVSTTDSEDLYGFCSVKSGQIIGSIFFSRFTVPTQQFALLLSPVAVATREQKQGIGQQLIQFGLNSVKKSGVEIVVTYGDPDYYAKTGFEPISEAVIPAPYPLSQPHGWLALTLTQEAIEHMVGKTQCVSAFEHREYW